MLRLNTVRAKLTTLVVLSVVVTVACLPVLSWILRRQLIDEVDDRVVESERAFQVELEDDIADLTLAARVIASDGDTARAIRAGDAAAARQLASVFLGVYHEIDILVVEANGHVLAQVGCTKPPEHIEGIGELRDVLTGREITGVVRHGCESSTTDAPPAYVIAVPVSGVGAVVVCLPFNRAYLENASRKLGLELAFAVVDAAGKNAFLGATGDFPTATLDAIVSSQPSLAEDHARTWAVARFTPPLLAGHMGRLGMVAALDVTDVQAIVRRNLLGALVFLLLPAAASIIVGWRLASVMSRALRRVNLALKKVEQLEYVHVEIVPTGDELEDLASGFNTMVDGLKERDKLRTTFGKYMTEAVMDHLLAGKVQLGGETLPVTILFTDIRSFTSISEQMDAQALVELLNEYFTEMVGIVMQEEGVVDKYIGDAIMAVFGAPVPKPEDAANAVRAAVRMRRALAGLNVRLVARGLPPLRTGIGLHTGEVVAGNIGSEKRMEYTVIGDAVNLASRLEGATKELGVDILVSEDTYRAARGMVVARPVREIKVKGREQPVMTYEVLGLPGEPPLERPSHADAPGSTEAPPLRAVSLATEPE